MTHEQWTALGDRVDVAGQWLAAAVFWVAAALSGSVLGVTALLGILDMIGGRT